MVIWLIPGFNDRAKQIEQRILTRLQHGQLLQTSYFSSLQMLTFTSLCLVLNQITMYPSVKLWRNGVASRLRPWKLRWNKNCWPSPMSPASRIIRRYGRRTHVWWRVAILQKLCGNPNHGELVGCRQLSCHEWSPTGEMANWQEGNNSYHKRRLQCSECSIIHGRGTRSYTCSPLRPTSHKEENGP